MKNLRKKINIFVQIEYVLYGVNDYLRILGNNKFELYNKIKTLARLN